MRLKLKKKEILQLHGWITVARANARAEMMQAARQEPTLNSESTIRAIRTYNELSSLEDKLYPYTLDQ